MSKTKAPPGEHWEAFSITTTIRAQQPKAEHLRCIRIIPHPPMKINPPLMS